MSANEVVTYSLDVGRRRSPKRTGGPHPDAGTEGIPRIARLLALAIRLDGLVRSHSIRDYAAVARAGLVTRARITQIMKLLDLAPDIQEQILFLPPMPRFNERNLRPIANQIDWQAQRKLFQQLIGGRDRESASRVPLAGCQGRA